MNKFAERGFRQQSDYQEATALMRRLSDAAAAFEHAWASLEAATGLVKPRLPEEYGTIAQTSLQAWQVWQAFERTCQTIEDIESQVLRIENWERRAEEMENSPQQNNMTKDLYS